MGRDKDGDSGPPKVPRVLLVRTVARTLVRGGRRAGDRVVERTEVGHPSLGPFGRTPGPSTTETECLPGRDLGHDRRPRKRTRPGLRGGLSHGPDGRSAGRTPRAIPKETVEPSLLPLILTTLLALLSLRPVPRGPRSTVLSHAGIRLSGDGSPRVGYGTGTPGVSP